MKYFFVAGNRKAHGYVQRAKQQVLSGCSTDPPPEDHIYLPPCGTVEEEGACALPPHNEKATAKVKAIAFLWLKE